MNIVDAKKCVKTSIKGYKLQRNNEVFNNGKYYSPVSVINTYNLFSPNIAMLLSSPKIATIVGAFGIASLVSFSEKIVNHPLSYYINVLKNTESLLNCGCNNLSHLTEEKFEEKTLESISRYVKCLRK